MGRGGYRPGSGRKPKPRLPKATKDTATEVFSRVSEIEMWLSLLEDRRTRLPAMIYLSNRKYGLPPQSIAVGSVGPDGLPVPSEEAPLVNVIFVSPGDTKPEVSQPQTIDVPACEVAKQSVPPTIDATPTMPQPAAAEPQALPEPEEKRFTTNYFAQLAERDHDSVIQKAKAEGRRLPFSDFAAPPDSDAALAAARAEVRRLEEQRKLREEELERQVIEAGPEWARGMTDCQLEQRKLVCPPLERPAIEAELGRRALQRYELGGILTVREPVIVQL